MPDLTTSARRAAIDSVDFTALDLFMGIGVKVGGGIDRAKRIGGPRAPSLFDDICNTRVLMRFTAVVKMETAEWLTSEGCASEGKGCANKRQAPRSHSLARPTIILKTKSKYVAHLEEKGYKLP